MDSILLISYMVNNSLYLFSNRQNPLNVAITLCTLENLYSEVTELFYICARPILIANLLSWELKPACALIISCTWNTNLSILLHGTQHHNHSTVSLHYHLPEVTTGDLHGVLSNNKCLLLFVALKSNGMQFSNNEYKYILYLRWQRKHVCSQDDLALVALCVY